MLKEVHQPNPTNSQPTTAGPPTAILKRKSPPQSYKIPIITRKLSPPPLMSLTLTPTRPQQPLQQTHIPSFPFPTIFPKTIAELMGIIPQKPRETTMRITF